MNILTHVTTIRNPARACATWLGLPSLPVILGSPKRLLATWARRFLANECGTTLAMTAVVMVPLMGFIGLGIDTSRGFLVKARLGDALDAAVLAAAHVTDTADLQAEIQKYFDVNFPPGYMGATVTLNPVVLSGVEDQIVNISASAEIDSTIMRLFGSQTLSITNATEVTRQTVSMDVVLSMDMSGSMDWSDGAGSTRIAAARTAAHTLIDILYGNKSSKSTLLVGLVPWNGAVNVWLNGTTRYRRSRTTTTAVPTFTDPWDNANQSVVYNTTVTPVPFLDKPDRDWNGCVFARYKTSLDNPDGIADHLLGPVTTTDGTEWLAWEDSSDDYGDCLSQGITPLTDERTTIEDAIDDLTDPDGVTNIAQGLAWAWRVVSPGEPFAEADPFPQGLHERAIVLLTDGQNYGGTDDGYDRQFGGGSSAGPAGMDDRLRAVAANAKAQGIKVYVIQFYYSSGPLQALLQEVATEPAAPFYHFAADGDALNNAFKEIADDLSALRISK